MDRYEESKWEVELGAPDKVNTSYPMHDTICVKDRVGLAQSVVSSPLGRVIPKTIIKVVQTASLHRHACVSVGV